MINCESIENPLAAIKRVPHDTHLSGECALCEPFLLVDLMFTHHRFDLTQRQEGEQVKEAPGIIIVCLYKVLVEVVWCCQRAVEPHGIASALSKLLAGR